MDRLVFFNDTATTEIYTLSLHDALPISLLGQAGLEGQIVGIGDDEGVVDVLEHLEAGVGARDVRIELVGLRAHRSEEHTSELQSRQYIVCRLLLEKKYLLTNLYLLLQLT